MPPTKEHDNKQIDNNKDIFFLLGPDQILYKKFGCIFPFSLDKCQRGNVNESSRVVFALYVSIEIRQEEGSHVFVSVHSVLFFSKLPILFVHLD